MVLAHIAQCSGMIVISAALFHSYGFTESDLNVGDMLIVPQRFKERIGKTDHFDVLHHFLAQIVVDPVDLFFLEHLADLLVELLRRFQVVAERLLDHQTVPA
ncbi:hypothetical protein D3C81_1733980 [compost metagenome]